MAAIDVAAVVTEIAAQAAPIASVAGAVLLVAWVLPFSYRMIRRTLDEGADVYEHDEGGHDPLGAELVECYNCGEEAFDPEEACCHSCGWEP